LTVSDRIYQEVKKLPEPLQAEVLDFVQHLTSKAERATESESSLRSLSLSLAMRGMEEEDTPDYSVEDLKEVFS